LINFLLILRYLSDVVFHDKSGLHFNWQASAKRSTSLLSRGIAILKDSETRTSRQRSTRVRFRNRTTVVVASVQSTWKRRRRQLRSCVEDGRKEIVVTLVVLDIFLSPIDPPAESIRSYARPGSSGSSTFRVVFGVCDAVTIDSCPATFIDASAFKMLPLPVTGGIGFRREIRVASPLVSVLCQVHFDDSSWGARAEPVPGINLPTAL